VARQQYKEAARRQRVWRKEGDNPEWSEKDPCMAVAIAEGGCVEEVAEGIASEVRKSFFANTTYELLAEPENEEAENEAIMLYCDALLDEYEEFPNDQPDFFEHIPQVVLGAFDEILKVCRAVVAVWNPNPGYKSSSYSDAFDVFSPDADFEKNDDMDTFVKIALKSKYINRKIMAYFSEAKDDDVIAAEYQGLVTAFESDKGVGATKVGEALRLIDEWRPPRVREAGLNQLCTLLQGWIVMQWSSGETSNNLFIDGKMICDACDMLSAVHPVLGNSVAHIRTALKSESKKAAQAKALSAAVDAMAGWTNDVAKLDESVMPQLRAASGLNIVADEDVVKAATFKSMVASEITRSVIAAKTQIVCRTYLMDTKAKLRSAYQSAYALSKQANITDVAGQMQLHTLFEDLAAAAMTVQLDLLNIELYSEKDEGLDENEFYKAACALWASLADWEALKGQITTGFPTLIPEQNEFNLLTKHMTPIIKEARTKAMDKSKELKTMWLMNLAKLKAKLGKVNGGLDNGKSWKHDLNREASFGDEDMKEHFEAVKQAYCKAITSRMADMKKVQCLAMYT
jgi:hypothetical protein